VGSSTSTISSSTAVRSNSGTVAPAKSLHIVPGGTSATSTTAFSQLQKPPSATQQQQQLPQPREKFSEGLLAGSYSGHIRYWVTSSQRPLPAKGVPLWSVLADTQRAAATAAPVVSLVALPAWEERAIAVGEGTSGSTGTGAVTAAEEGRPRTVHRQLLLSATALGVVSLWDLSVLTPQKFGSTAPEPRCLRRLDLSAKMLIFEHVTLLGVTSAFTYTASKFREDAGYTSGRSDNLIDVVEKSSSASTGTCWGGKIVPVCANFVATLSTGKVFSLNISTLRVKEHSSSIDKKGGMSRNRSSSSGSGLAAAGEVIGGSAIELEGIHRSMASREGVSLSYQEMQLLAANGSIALAGKAFGLQLVCISHCLLPNFYLSSL
jgi:hypothetical protein